MADPNVSDALNALASFARARWGYRFRSRDRMLAWQRGQVRRFLKEALPRAPFYGRTARDLAELPVIDLAVQRENFGALNTRGISLERALAVARAAERSDEFVPVLDGVLVGYTMGELDQRRPYLVSQRERTLWVGFVAARVLSAASLAQVLSPWRRPLRVALIVGGADQLCSVVRTPRIRFVKPDPDASLGDQVGALNENPPDVLVAPPSVLLRLADASDRGLLRIAPRQVVSIAEMLDEVDAERVRSAFGGEVSHVFQAAEGLLAYTCPRGTLHLNEEHLRFEKRWLDETHTRFAPVITAFTRDTQLTVRLRLDDVLRIADAACDCRHRGLAIAAVDGRNDALLSMPRSAASGRSALRPTVTVFPDQIERAVSPSRAAGLFDDWRVVQHSDELVVQLLSPRSGAERAVERELAHVFATAGADAPIIRFEEWHPETQGARLRRIRTA